MDPGYWGKLCIPLHNLTDEDYSIPLEDGLIWIEFTKTTTGHNGSGSRGRRPHDENDGYWEVRDFVERAARPIKGTGASVPIRSSISKVRERADSAAVSAEKAEQKASNIVSYAALGVGVALFVLAIGLTTFIRNIYDSVATRTDDLERRVSRIAGMSTDMGLENIPSAMRRLTMESEQLREKFDHIEGMVTDLQRDVRLSE